MKGAGLEEMVCALRQGTLSRNRSFDALEGAKGRRAQRVHRLLQALERELASPDARVAVLPTLGDRVALTVERAAVRLKRVVYLELWELKLLEQTR